MIKEFLRGEGDYSPFLVVISIVLLALLGLALCNINSVQSVAGRKFVDSPELVYEFRVAPQGLNEVLLRTRCWMDDENYYVETEAGGEITLPKKHVILTELLVFKEREYKEPEPGVVYKFIGEGGKVYESDSFLPTGTAFIVRLNGSIERLKREKYKAIRVETKDYIKKAKEVETAYIFEIKGTDKTEKVYAFSYAEDDSSYIIKQDGGDKYIPKEMATVVEVGTECISPLVKYKSPLIVITDNGVVYEVKSAYEFDGKVTIFKDNEKLEFPVGAVKVIPKEGK